MFQGQRKDWSASGQESRWFPKILSIISIAREVGLPPGVASKLYGVANFIETGMYARIGRAGLWAVRDRQKETGFEITPAIAQSFNLLADLFKLRPRREYSLWNSLPRRAVTASDAAYENGRGSAGFLSVMDPGMPEETRLGKVISLTTILYSLCCTRSTYIAQLELLAVLVALTEVAGLPVGRVQSASYTMWQLTSVHRQCGTGERLQRSGISGHNSSGGASRMLRHSLSAILRIRRV